MRGWETGWSYMIDKKGNVKYPWAKPIRDVLRNEQAEARARQMRIEEEARASDRKKREEMRQASIEAISQEAQVVKAMRANVIGLNRITGQVILAALPVVERLKASLETAQLDPKKVTDILARVAYLARQTSESARLAIELERLRLGDPNEVIKELPGVTDVTPEEAAAELGRLGRSLERAKKLGLSVIVSDEELPDRASGDE